MSVSENFFTLAIQNCNDFCLRLCESNFNRIHFSFFQICIFIMSPPLYPYIHTDIYLLGKLILSVTQDI